MDFGSLIGFLSGLGMVTGAIIYEGNLDQFINTPGLMIVIGGTLSATLLNYKLTDVMIGFRAVHRVFTSHRENPNDVLNDMLILSRTAQIKGHAAIENLRTDKDSWFVKKAIELTAENTDEAIIRSALRAEIGSVKLRNMVSEDIFRKMSMYAPGFGMIGTLIGLIQMLSAMDDPSQVGPSMATALTTTFYGSVLSTMIFTPIAGKLKSRTLESVTNLEIIYISAVSIKRGEHPLSLYEQAIALIPLGSRRPFEMPELK
jgi:chemotaxis protein MotA